ncbi:MAG: DUF2304 domain-containing protein [Candidatus Sumerlaeia bacterium]|nr:DUF2304 domain-containing protein [Candidatus Sumerlaeia bacterium]
MGQDIIVFAAPTPYQRMLGVVVGLALIVLTLRMIRRFHLKEEHALPWLIGGGLLILFSVFTGLLKVFTYALGAGAPSTAIFVGCLFFLLVQSLIFSSVLSQQKRQIQNLAIALALQQAELRAAQEKETHVPPANTGAPPQSEA